MKPNRLFYIDNLRIFLISLVVLHHFAITYGAPGDWYYNETEASFPEVLFRSMFVATNQSFFMGMFFFISAFFILPSLERKGLKKFISDRLLRLGIPLLVFYFVLSPLTVFIRDFFIAGKEARLAEYLIRGWGRGFGPLWFVEALLFFTFVFLMLRQTGLKLRIKFPGTAKIIAFALVTGLLQFIIRIERPVGWSMPFTNFQFPFFVQYIFLFGLGIIAYKNNWLESISFQTGKRWFLFAQSLIFVAFPLLFIAGGAAQNGTDAFMGGFTWQSLGYAVWEQVLCVSLIIGLLGISKELSNKQGNTARQLSESAYGVFVFHAPLIVGVSAFFAGWDISGLLKFLILSPIALVTCFLTAWIAKQIPGVKNVL